MCNKAIFIDIDGTLADYFGRIPVSAVEALSKSRKRGNKIFLCTGRSKAEYNLILDKIEVDGVIGAGGAFIEVDKKVIKENFFSAQEIDYLSSYLNNSRISFYLAGEKYLYVNETMKKKFKIVGRFLPNDKGTLFKDISEVDFMKERIYKVNFIQKKFLLTIY
ncbi:HAD hydrolase family protein [Enterococcus sp. LJL90]